MAAKLDLTVWDSRRAPGIGIKERGERSAKGKSP